MSGYLDMMIRQARENATRHGNYAYAFGENQRRGSGGAKSDYSLNQNNWVGKPASVDAPAIRAFKAPNSGARRDYSMQKPNIMNMPRGEDFLIKAGKTWANNKVQKDAARANAAAKEEADLKKSVSDNLKKQIPPSNGGAAGSSKKTPKGGSPSPVGGAKYPNGGGVVPNEERVFPATGPLSERFNAQNRETEYRQQASDQLQQIGTTRTNEKERIIAQQLRKARADKAREDMKNQKPDMASRSTDINGVMSGASRTASLPHKTPLTDLLRKRSGNEVVEPAVQPAVQPSVQPAVQQGTGRKPRAKVRPGEAEITSGAADVPKPPAGLGNIIGSPTAGNTPSAPPQPSTSKEGEFVETKSGRPRKFVPAKPSTSETPGNVTETPQTGPKAPRARLTAEEGDPTEAPTQLKIGGIHRENKPIK